MLAQRAPDAVFRLDDRSDATLLAQLQAYVGLIPFDTSGNTWADFFFMSGLTPDSLAQVFANTDGADGMLLPQQAFLLAFLQLLKTPRALLNALPLAHRNLYYRSLLGLDERPAQADHVVLGFTLSPTARACFLAAGTLFDGGDAQDGAPVRYALDDDVLVNPSAWTDLRWVQPDPADSDPTSPTMYLSATPYEQGAVAWPAAGVRLFDSSTTQTSVISGRMIASESLGMTSGTRQFSVTFSASVTAADVTVAQVSAGDVWLDLALDPSSPLSGTTLIWVLSQDAPAISAPQGLDGMTLDVPVMRLGSIAGKTVPQITALTVTVNDPAALRYSTDSGVSRPENISYPFGTAPVVGNSFNLMLPDWCGRSTTIDLTVTPNWIGLPTVDFPAWHAGYDASVAPASNADFVVSPLLVSSVGASALVPPGGTGTTTQPLFASTTGAPVAAPLKVRLPAELPVSDSEPSDPCDWPRWVRFELTGRDFGYQYYQTHAGTETLNPPYTPQINSMSIVFTVTAAGFTQYQLTPFGYIDGSAAAPSGGAKSYLYVGLTDGTPGETLSLYWKLQSPQTLTIEWTYLNESNAWISLEDTLVDGTQGLLDSGLWTAILPHDAANDAPCMPAGRFWIRAEIVRNAVSNEGDIWLQDILANAMTATLDAPETVPADHFRSPLAAGTISRPVTPNAALGSVTQPWASTGGAPAQTPMAFFAETAQRLSHRMRALTWRDMANLLNAQYPEVFDAAIPPADTITKLPASVTQSLVVIPVNARKDNQDLLRPVFSTSHLNEMAGYLQAHDSAWATIVLKNPTYRDVTIAYDVEFNVNPDYGYRQLKERLTLRYMPWILDGQRGVTVGNTLDFYGIMAFIESQPFVVEVNDMTLDGARVSVEADVDQVLILAWPDADTRTFAIGAASTAARLSPRTRV
ncbi:hypothetical protein D7S86_12350 [Pararobbsia silviterrae]|uniref:Baseplate protein J-like domain-containing protein n=1 Tax=Pararobbsia silviterrae TaxID=1792498 RepID=A0A494XZM7_9BURK|nr:hypothetical protein D7S86_12350 [Pararobbsia silviterrae]